MSLSRVYTRLGNIIHRLREASVYPGWGFILSYRLKRIGGALCMWHYDRSYKKYIDSRMKERFSMGTESINYLKRDFSYNCFSQSERKLELPIGLYYCDKFKGKKILELGNVMSHYVDVKHEVIDKYECAPGVLNVDVVDFHPTVKYDLIVSISTVEHIGKDDLPKDQQKALMAVDLMKTWITQSGVFILTFGLGYNKDLDVKLFNDNFGMEVYYMKRVSTENLWIEIQEPEARKMTYGFPYPFANVVAVCVYKH